MSGELNESQSQAIKLLDGPIMILAGAGSGKTRTLVSRVTHLYEARNVAPYEVLALTFSNKAAKEMRERISRKTGLDEKILSVTTFHSFCARLLRYEYRYLGLSKNFTIYDDQESMALIKSLIENKGLSPKELSPYSVKYFIEELKNLGHYEGRSVSSFTWRENHNLEIKRLTNDELYPFWFDYESELTRSNAVDFGGLITAVLKLFETFPEVLERYQQKYQYLLVDEYQDTNSSQFDLLVLLAGKHRNICVVGDEDQSIYSWRGADIRNILDFDKVFPESQLIKLEQNYRSTKKIIEAASHVISHNQMRSGKTLWTDNEEGEAISVIEVETDIDEANYVSGAISKLKQQGKKLSDIAVFYRNNAQSRVLEDSLRKKNISYRIIGGIRFYDRKEIKDILSYFKLVTNPKDSLAFARVLNVPTRGIGATSLRKMEFEAHNLERSLWEIAEGLVQFPHDYPQIRLSSKASASLRDFVGLINDVKQMNETGVLPSLSLKKIINDSGLGEYYKRSKDYESMARVENMEELLNAVEDFERNSPNKTLVAFLESITLDTSLESENGEKGEEVALMTIHGAKGLEFPYVFLTGVEENIFPSYKSLESDEKNLEEERRLFYVAMTRAMSKLCISFSQTRFFHGSSRFNGPSRFIKEIPSTYYKWDRKTQYHQKNQNKDDYYFHDEQPCYDGQVKHSSYNVEKEREKDQGQFPKGVLVNHAVYGVGRVVQVEGTGKDEKVTIEFPGQVRKKFLVRCTPITMMH